MQTLKKNYKRCVEEYKQLLFKNPIIFNELNQPYSRTDTNRFNLKDLFYKMRFQIIIDISCFFFVKSIQPPIVSFIDEHPIVTILTILILIYTFFYDYINYMYNWTIVSVTKIKIRYRFYKNWKRPKRKPQKWHPLKQDLVNFIRFRILHKIMTRETFMVLLYIFLGFVILFWKIFFTIKNLLEFIQFIWMRHLTKIRNNPIKKITKRHNPQMQIGACERILGYNLKNGKKAGRATRDFTDLKKNTLSTNHKPNGTEDTNKTNKSWKQLLILRLCVVFGLLIFLLFSYLFSESFDINKIQRQWTLFLQDTDWSKTTKLIGRCWHNYINIWDYKQWTVSILGIIPAYWFLFDLLFWVKLIDKPFTPSQKIFFIGTDLFLNLVVGLVYMAYPHNVIGALMYKCPVALSPYFIIIEITMYLLFRAWLKYRTNKKAAKP